MRNFDNFIKLYSIFLIFLASYIIKLITAVPPKRFGSADCDTIYTIYLSLCTKSEEPNPFLGTVSILLINLIYIVCIINKWSLYVILTCKTELQINRFKIIIITMNKVVREEVIFELNTCLHVFVSKCCMCII